MIPCLSVPVCMFVYLCVQICVCGGVWVCVDVGVCVHAYVMHMCFVLSCIYFQLWTVIYKEINLFELMEWPPCKQQS